MSSLTNIPSPPPSGPPAPNFIDVLRLMLSVSDKVSDLIFWPGRPPQVELAGKLQPVRIPGLEKLTPAHTASIAKLMIGNQQAPIETLEKTGSADLSFSARAKVVLGNKFSNSGYSRDRDARYPSAPP